MTRALPPPASLEHYEPRQGLKTVAVAETAERYFRRAKDATRLLEAVELKLAEQRKFVLWWDQQGLHGGNRRGKDFKIADSAILKPGRDGIPDEDTLHRWRARLKDETRYTAALQTAQTRALRVCEFSKGQTDQRGASGTNENEWFTPLEYIEAARDVLDAIDLDPATHPLAQATIKAASFYTRGQDGLGRPWPGRIWLNPPYMQPDIARFVEKLVEEFGAGRTTAAVLLTHNYTDTAWFHRAASVCAAICFTRGRIRFLSPDDVEAAPTQGQAFFYYGPTVERFVLRFAEIGLVVRPCR